MGLLLVIGGSGAMGRNVIRHVLQSEESSWRVRVFTRDPLSSECRALAQLRPGRVEFAKGNLEDEASLRSAFKGVQSVFCNTNYWSCFQELLSRRGNIASDLWPVYRQAEEAEIRQGTFILELARETDVEHFVYSSLDAMAKPSRGRFPAPHFDAKASVAEFIDLQKAHARWYAEHTTVLVTAPYMENFQSSRMFRGGGNRAAVHLNEDGARPCLLLRVPIGSALWPMVTLNDIGWFAAHVLDHHRHWSGRTLSIASEALAMQDIADIFRRVTGIEAIYEPYTLAEYEGLNLPGSSAIANMFGFIEQFGIARDFTKLKFLKSGLDTFESWLKTTRWRGRLEAVQKELAAVE